MHETAYSNLSIHISYYLGILLRISWIFSRFFLVSYLYLKWIYLYHLCESWRLTSFSWHISGLQFFLTYSPKSFLFFILYLIVIKMYFSQADFLKNKYRETLKCLVNIKEKYSFLIIVNVFLLVVKKYARGWINMAFPKNCNSCDKCFITKTSAPTL